jgi:metal-dependent HD superfamily phosphatase/phosphodiesterase
MNYLKQNAKSPKEISLDRKLRAMTSGKAREALELLIGDDEIHAMQEFANTVSIRRLHFNDHGPVHMRKVALNALTMMNLLRDAGVKLSLEEEDAGSFEESTVAVLLAAFLHDVGMTVGRQDHEHSSMIISTPYIDRITSRLYPDDPVRKIVCKSMALEGIVGHMGQQRIHSREAGIILIADGCDMEKGRARIPMSIQTESQVGDIHKYSATAIENVRIEKGEEHPIRISVEMSASVGFFQIEEVLFRKINSSPIKDQIELFAYVIGRDVKRYL